MEHDKFVEGADGSVNVRTILTNTLVPETYDYVSFSYTGNNITEIEFYEGGSGGDVVATLTLAYDVDDNLTSVTKS